MDEVNKDVKQEEAQPSQESTEEQKQPENVSEDEKTTQGVVDKGVYESVQEALRREREEKKQAKSENSELLKRLEALESRDEDSEDEDKPVDYRSELLWLQAKDPFVKDNLDLIEQEVAEHPRKSIADAVSAVKVKIFDRMNTEISQAEIKPPKQAKPTATAEEEQPELTGDPLKDALEGKLNVSQLQLDAMRHQLRK